LNFARREKKSSCSVDQQYTIYPNYCVQAHCSFRRVAINIEGWLKSLKTYKRIKRQKNKFKSPNSLYFHTKKKIPNQQIFMISFKDVEGPCFCFTFIFGMLANLA
jgi:hypothetical protein